MQLVSACKIFVPGRTDNSFSSQCSVSFHLVKGTTQQHPGVREVLLLLP